MNPAVAEWTVEALSRLFLTFAIVLGVGILLGGEIRLSNSNYYLIKDFPGAPESWALAAIIPGVVGLWGSLEERFNLVAWSLGALALWSAVFCYGTLHALFVQPTAGITAVCAWGVISITLILLGVVNRKID